MESIMRLEIMSLTVILPVTLIAAALAVYLLVRSTRRRVALSLLGLAAGAAIGAIVFWWLVDVQNTFGVELSATNRLWVILGAAGVGLAVVNLFASPWWRKVIAVVAIPIFLLTAALHINADFGSYRTLAQLFDQVSYPKLAKVGNERGEVVAGVVDYAATWKAPADMPKKGELRQASIPGEISKFEARDAVIWLPPAAFTDKPPVLPVLFVLSGQPGSPSDSFQSGQLDQILDKYAAEHNGIAPIAIAPDHLGTPGTNPMCTDTKAFGNVGKYLSEDVPNWVRDHFRVSSDPRMWAVEGYSAGATCTTQLVSGYPKIFGSGIASLSEIVPKIGSEAETVKKGFGNSQAAYDAVKPSAVMRANTPYADTLLIFGTGERSEQFTEWAEQLHADAQAAGMHTKLMREPTGHDWYSVRGVFEKALPEVGKRMGIN